MKLGPDIFIDRVTVFECKQAATDVEAPVGQYLDYCCKKVMQVNKKNKVAVALLPIEIRLFDVFGKDLRELKLEKQIH